MTRSRARRGAPKSAPEGSAAVSGTLVGWPVRIAQARAVVHAVPASSVSAASASLLAAARGLPSRRSVIPRDTPPVPAADA